MALRCAAVPDVADADVRNQLTQGEPVGGDIKDGQVGDDSVNIHSGQGQGAGFDDLGATVLRYLVGNHDHPACAVHEIRDAPPRSRRAARLDRRGAAGEPDPRRSISVRVRETAASHPAVVRMLELLDERVALDRLPAGTGIPARHP
jgi:hypothetical protein